MKHHAGFGSRITRRDFLNGAALGAGGALLAAAAPGLAGNPPADTQLSPAAGWYGYGGVGDFRLSHGNTPEVVATAHRLRGGGYPGRLDRYAAVDEEYDLVIVGGGIAGLGAALEYGKRRRPGQSCLLLENHPIFGGEAKENEFDVDGTRLIGPQGSNGFFIPEAVSDPARARGDARYYAELCIPREFRLRDWPGDERPLRFCGDNYEYLVRGLEQHTSVGNFFAAAAGGKGAWAIDMFGERLANTPLDEATRRTLLAWHAAGAARTFDSDAEAVNSLDQMSYEAFLTRVLGLGAAAARQADLFLASACGLGSDAVSAYAAYRLPMPGLSDALPPDLRRVSFPGGNSGFARHFVKRLIPAAIEGGERFEDIVTGRIRLEALDRPGQALRMRLDATALGVAHDGAAPAAGTVSVLYVCKGRLRRVRARAVVMATGGWINRHVVRDLPDAHRDAYARFLHAPFLVANVALTNWRFLHRLGVTAAIWEREADGFGYTCNIRNPMQVGNYRPPLDPDRPTILSFYTPFFSPGLPAEAQVAAGRAELLNTSYAEYERRLRAQMLRLFAASGFDPENDVAGIILNRWGHAYSVPFPGFFGGTSGRAPRDVIRKAYGRIAFAHAELDGLQHWGPAADEGRRAVEQLADAIHS